MRSNFLIVMRMRKRFMGNALPPLRQALKKGYANRSEARREEGQAESQQNRQEFPRIELMAVRRLEQDGRGDVQQDADQQAVQGTEVAAS